MILTTEELKKAKKELFISDEGIIKMPSELYKNIMLICGGCGRGKTTFALSTAKNGLLATVNRRLKRNALKEIKDIKPFEVVFLTSRAIIRDQQLISSKKYGNAVEGSENKFCFNAFGEIEDEDKIRVMTAHKFGKLAKEGKILIMPKIIIIDEIHTIFSDTIFASDLFFAIEYVKNHYNDIVKFGLTATPQILETIKDDKLTFEQIDIDLGSKYTTEEVKILLGGSLETYIAQKLPSINSQNKMLVYTMGATDCYKLADQCGDKAAYIISDSNEKEVDGVKIADLMKEKGWKEEIIKTEKFPKGIDLLIVNSSVREGMNIKDSTVKTVICEAADLTTATQILGRIRGDLKEFTMIANKKNKQMYDNNIKELVKLKKELEEAETEEKKQIIMAMRWQKQKDNNKLPLFVFCVNEKELKYKFNNYAEATLRYISECYEQIEHSKDRYNSIKLGEKELKLCEDYFNELHKYTDDEITIEKVWAAAISKNHSNAIDRFKAIEKEWLNKPLTTADKKELCKQLGVIREGGKVANWPTVKEVLQSGGYLIKDKRITVDGKQIYISIITIR